MADLLHILPDFDTESYSYLLNSLDRHQIITSDLLALETTELAKRAKLPLPQLRTLVEEITRKLHVTSGIHEDDIGIGPVNQAETNGANEADSKHEILKGVWSERQLDFIGTLDERLDSALAGGFPTGHVSEVTGERYYSAPPDNFVFASLTTFDLVERARLSFYSVFSCLPSCSYATDRHLRVYISPLNHPCQLRD